MDDEQLKAFLKETVEASNASILGQVKTLVSESATALRTDVTKLIEKQPAPVTPPVTPPTSPVTPPVTPPTPGAPVDPVLNSQMLDLRKSNEKLLTDMQALTKARADDQKRADEAERVSAVTGALNTFQFATPTAQQTAVEKLLAQVKRTDAGQLIAGDNLTVEAFAKDYIPRDHAYLLAPVQTGGTGVTGSGPSGQRKTVDYNDIKSGMTADQRAAVVSSINAAAGELGIKL